MRSHQASFIAVTLSIILSACGEGSAVSESDQVADQRNQNTNVSNGGETIENPSDSGNTTSGDEETTEVATPVTTSPVVIAPVYTAPGNTTTESTPSAPTTTTESTTPESTATESETQATEEEQTASEPAEVFGAARLTSASISGDNVILDWSQDNDVPQGGYSVSIDGVNSEDLSNISSTTATVQGLDLSLRHCFTVRAQYTQATPAEYFTSNTRCTDAQEAENQAPVISGNPAGSVDAGGTYSFTPNATDGDNDDLTFSVNYTPAWLHFNDQTGELSGSPTADDVGSYNDIVISVSDGTDEVSLGGFAITVNAVEAEPDTGSIPLSWVAPTTRTDGSTLRLSDIQGYCIYIGTTRNDLQMVADINQGDRTSYVLDNLELGDYYVAVSVYDQEDNMSSYSNVVLKTAVN
jgi:hypothetical protein